jgi:hypothetical protein
LIDHYLGSSLGTANQNQSFVNLRFENFSIALQLGLHTIATGVGGFFFPNFLFYNFDISSADPTIHSNISLLTPSRFCAGR